MKFKSLCATTLATVIAASTLGGAASAATVATPLETKAKLTVKLQSVDPENPGEGVIDPTDPTNPVIPVDPTDPTNPLVPIVPNPQAGSFGIQAASNLDFGEILTGIDAVTVNAKPLSDAAGANRSHLVQWVDFRDGSEVGYTVQANMTGAFTNGTDSIDGAEITYNNLSFVKPVVDEAGAITAVETRTDVKSAAPAEGAKISATEGAVNFATADTATDSKGKGVTQMNFGTDPAAPAISLNIPAAARTNLKATTYTATIQWNIIAGPEA